MWIFFGTNYVLQEKSKLKELCIHVTTLTENGASSTYALYSRVASHYPIPKWYPTHEPGATILYADKVYFATFSS